MSAIFNALGQGRTADEILKFLTKAMPQLSRSISKATQQGYNSKQILGFLSKTFETEDRTGMSESERIAVNKRADARRSQYGLQMAAGIGATALAAPMAASALQRAMPSSLQGLIPQLAGQATGQTASQAQTGQPLPNQTSQPIAQTPPINTNVIPTIPQTQPINQQEIVNKIKELSSIGKSPADIVELFTQKAPEEISKVEKETGKKFIDFIQESVADPAELARRKALETFKGKERERVETAYPELQKQSVVATPQGVGEVLKVRNGKAIVEVDGKKHQLNEDELIKSPLPEKDLADLHDDLIKGIEKHTEEEVSRMVNFSGYDEGTNSLAFLPYDGALYIYDNLSDEEKAIAMNLMAKRKTSGENHIGAWVEGTKSPAGAAMSAFIKQLQATRGGKGNEYQRKYQTVYSAFEPAIKASKEKKKKKKKP